MQSTETNVRKDNSRMLRNIYLNIFCFAVFTTMFTQYVALSSLQSTYTRGLLFKKNPLSDIPLSDFFAMVF